MSRGRDAATKRRTIVAVTLAMVALALLVIGIPPTFTALHARRAAASSCDESLRGLSPGTWVRLRGCGVDMFHAGFLDDPAGTRSHRVAPLRTSRGSAAEPGRVALAIPAASARDANVFRTTTRTDSPGSQVADLGETTGVVWGRLDTLPFRLVEVPGFDHGLAPDAIVIELRTVPALTRSAAVALAGFAGIALAVFTYRRSERASRPTARGRSPAPPVRWGLVFIAVLVGVVALWRGLQVYFDPMRQPEWANAAAAVPRATASKAEAAPTPGLPGPTREELALVGSTDSANQLKGADALLARAVTADLVAAVESALLRHPGPDLEARLVCLKSRFEGPETLEFLLARFPKDRMALDWNLKPDVACVLEALVTRVGEAPERIRDALMPAVYAGNASTRSQALRAFRMMDLPRIPAMLVAETSTPGPFQREALQAALALGAIRLHPALVAGAIRDPYTRPLVKQELRADPHANAARIVANVWAERSVESELEELAREREGQMHDVSAALLEIVVNPSEPEEKRAAAAHGLERLGETGALHDLRAFELTLESGRLKAAVDAAVRVLEEHRKAGQREQMRALPR